MEQFRCYGCMQMISDPVCPHCGHPADGVNAPHQLPVGTVLAGRYMAGRAINQTETAIVYIAYDQTENSNVLVCEYFPGRAARREGAQVLADSAEGLDAQSRTAALLKAVPELSRISGTVDALRENGTVYLVLGQVRGPGLELYVRRRGGSLDPQEALRILHDVIGGLAILHQNGGAHGSIGMNRIVLDPMGGARLLGFGEVAGGTPGDDVYAISRVICDCIAPGAAPAAIPGLTEQQQMALDMGTRANPAERFNSAVALRRALFGEVTVPVEPVAPLAEQAPAPQPAVIPVIELPQAEATPPQAKPEMPKTEAIVSEAIPQMPKTEAIVSEVLTSAEPEPEEPAAVPFVAPVSSMPPTEIVTEFKVKYPVSQQPAAPQPEPAPEPAVPAYEMPRTEAAPVPPVVPAWDAQPQVPQQPQWEQPQWQPPEKKKKSGVAVGVIVGVVVALIAALVVCFLFVHIWKDATCEAPKTCAICGKTEGDVVDHEWLDATCEDPVTCEYCGDTQGKALGHKWQSATCETPKTCSVCGVTEGDVMPHAWVDATCKDPKTCAMCGATEGTAGGHTWLNATCDDPKTCSTCGKTEGSALGHNWKEATYTEPKTCTRCGATEGEPKGYMEYVSGDFQSFRWGSSNTHSYVFTRSIKGVKGFTLYFEPTFNYNAWVDDWKLLYQDTNGVWHEYGVFTLNTSSYEHTFSFSPTLDIKAIAVVPRINGTYSYSFSLGVWDLYYTN